MSHGEDRRHQAAVDAIVALAAARLSPERAERLGPFLRLYFHHVPAADLAERTVEALFGAAMAHWALARRRLQGETVVAAYTPRLEEHGWHSDRTVVQIVTDDMPFLVDSVTAELNRQDVMAHLVIHPVLRVRRGVDGRLEEVLAAETAGAPAESLMHFEMDGQPESRLATIRAGVLGVLDHVRAAVEDWSAMRARMRETIAALDAAPDTGDETRAFLTWLHDDNFTFLGCRDYDVSGSGAGRTVSALPESGLGLLRDPREPLFRDSHDLDTMPPDLCAFLDRPGLLMLTKTDHASPVHRRVRMDCVGIKRLDGSGRVMGERVFMGLFTAAAYNRSARDIPLIRLKIRTTLKNAGFRPDGHDGKVLTNILETYPRDELFQVSEEQLLATSLGIMRLRERQRLALFIRRDEFERFVSCLVFVPRDHYTTDLRLRIQATLEEAFSGSIQAQYSQLGDHPLARLHVLVRTTPGQVPDHDSEAIEARLVEEARSWSDRLQDALIATHGERHGLELFRRYRNAFPPGYQDRSGAETAVADVARIEEALASGQLAMSLYRPIETAPFQVRFKLYRPGAQVPLSTALPMLEHMGVRVMDEVPHQVHVAGNGVSWVMIHDFGLETRDGSAVDLGLIREAFQDTFRQVWLGAVESDGFNALVLGAGLTWRQVALVRACCKYLLQTGIPFSQSYMEQTLTANAGLARRMVELFLARCDPTAPRDPSQREARQAPLIAAFQDGLNAVAGADEDRILRRFLNVIQSVLRTNYFQRDGDGAPKGWLSLKLDGELLEELPLPRPFREIFVYSPRVEGVHLRSGAVARGGLRWSDRREDFRTEILGLLKSQVVKNAVIVPVGAKGGFVVKRPPAASDRDAVLAEGIECYRVFVRGLLDLTDTLREGQVVPPPDVARLDGDDPYLVVAADKGTASFSDIANALSAEYGFWLGDAFASGGSHGYDHKRMGITARGAWTSVERHFHELGLDCRSQNFTVVGVGDMSGDVFGNGMLLSPHIRLIGAFDHRHVFLDPDPDPTHGLAERRRLFETPGSTWADYDSALLSPGGAVYERRAKSVIVTPEIQALLGLARARVTPAELVRALLSKDVDLLWFGGIGTYVKATTETDAQVGDRANDAIRVNADQLRCKVIGEGANLAITQRGRIEAGLAGIKLNADFIDNSGGVDCSDHEVNIKIVLDAVTAAGDMTPKQRNRLLADMTEEVADLVLQDNHAQAQAISLMEARGAESLDAQMRLLRMLERSGQLNRGVAVLPDDDTLTERAGRGHGLTRPELAVLLAHAKIWMYGELLASDLPDDPSLAKDLLGYFPSPLRAAHALAAAGHPLRREIIATRTTNSLINRVGGTFAYQFMENTGQPPAAIARAYIIAREVHDLRALWSDIKALASLVSADVQTALLLEVDRLVEHATSWFLRTPNSLNIGEQVARHAPPVAEMARHLGTVLPERYHADLTTRAAGLADQGVPMALAERMAGLIHMASACDVARLAQAHNLKVTDTATLYFGVGTRFHLGRLRAAAEALPVSGHWRKLAQAALIEDIFSHQVDLTARVIRTGLEDTPAVTRTAALLDEILTSGVTDLAMVAVAGRQLRDLARS